MRYILVSSVVLLALATMASTKTPEGMTGSWVALNAMKAARTGACAAPLPDGRVLVTGGSDAAGALESAEILDGTGQFSGVAAMSSSRSGHTCSTLDDGRVLVAGGEN